MFDPDESSLSVTIGAALAGVSPEERDQIIQHLQSGFQ
jgi:alkylhydroperoxidase/carboxymuconolactone decarboxylase family protein YurZ